MQPQPLRPAEMCQLRQGIDDAGGGGPRPTGHPARSLANLAVLVKLATASAGRPNLPVSQPRVCRSISFAAGDVRQVASWGLYIATSVSPMTDASVTLGLKRPK